VQAAPTLPESVPQPPQALTGVWSAHVAEMFAVGTHAPATHWEAAPQLEPLAVGTVKKTLQLFWPAVAHVICPHVVLAQAWNPAPTNCPLPPGSAHWTSRLTQTPW
jgi:hypothetical protein